MRRRRAKRVERCICGLPITHPPIPPGAAWPVPGVPPEVVAAGHVAHLPNPDCQCAVCNSLR